MCYNKYKIILGDDKMSDKQLILNTVESIEDSKSYEEILCTLYVQYEIKKGIKDYEEGRVKTTEEVKEIINKC